MLDKRDIIAIVRGRLWSCNYKVKTIKSDTLDFNLLVEGKYKVKVIRVSRPSELPENASDVVIAAVMTNVIDRPQIVYIANGTTSNLPQGVMGYPDNKK